MKTFKNLVLVILTLLIWTALIGYCFVSGIILSAITSSEIPADFVKEVKELTKQEYVGNMSMTLIENGKVAESYFYSVGKPVKKNTAFPVASVSKWITSFGIMKLVEQGKLDLDTPIDDYLTRWHLPESEFDNKKVTIRKLLSHSSGLIDNLGYDGFALNETAQTIEESLIKASDSEYSEGVARVGYDPGTAYLYSGAGYTILQLLIEETTGQSFQEYMTQEVLVPLNMTNSTFVLSDKPNLQIASVYKDDGTIRPLRKFTALAAASLFTSTEDLSRFLIANITNNSVLEAKTITQMSLPETFINNIGVYGLGPHLYSQNDKESLIVGHDGSGGNALNTAARIDLTSKDGIIVLETGNHSLASSIADEWMFWKAGIADYVVMQRNTPFVISLLIVGYVMIIFLFFMFFRRKKTTLVAA